MKESYEKMRLTERAQLPPELEAHHTFKGTHSVCFVVAKDVVVPTEIWHLVADRVQAGNHRTMNEAVVAGLELLVQEQV